ncbi:MAG: thiamine phosphate synthase [Pyrinomonadaceae bacterium]
MNLVLPKIYPITDVYLSGLSHAEQVRNLIERGARMIQLRDKRASAGEFYHAALEAISAAAHDVKIIINDRVDIAMAVGAHGVHLGQDDMPPERARWLLGSGSIIGYSTHNVHRAAAASRLPVDYIAAGPIFTTLTKEQPDEPIGLEGLSAVRNAIGDIPLVAIGGIGAVTVSSVLAAGADSAAMIGGIIIDPRPLDDFLIPAV